MTEDSATMTETMAPAAESAGDIVSIASDFTDFAREMPDSRPAAPEELTPPSLGILRDVPVRVQAVLGRARLPIGELVRLGPGSVVDLDRRIGEPVDILVNDRLIARGEVVLIEDQLGLTVTEIVRQES